MKKATAIGILCTMLLGLAAWAGSGIIENKVSIKALQVMEKTIHEDVKEIKRDVKFLIRELK